MNNRAVGFRTPNQLHFHLEADEINFFQKNGHIGPFPLLDHVTSAELVETITKKIRQHPKLTGWYGWSHRRRKLSALLLGFLDRDFKSSAHKENDPHGSPQYWAKNVHLLIPEVAELGLRREVMDRINSILGKDVLLWGGWFSAKKVEVHRWHEDVEHREWNGATAWIGLSNVGPNSTMKVISGSHLFGTTPQEVAAERGSNLQSDGEVLDLARRFSRDAKVVQLDLKPGYFFLFSGRTWHGSINTSGKRRAAMIFQYCRPDTRVRIPCSYEIPTKWFRAQPWVMLASGEDRFGVNHVKTRSDQA